MANLRQSLQAMTEVEDVSKHPALLQALTLEHPNTVKLLGSPHPIERYTCLVHAFNFTEQPEYVVIAKRGFNVVFAGRAFAHWMIEHGFLAEINQEDALEGDLVFYFNGEAEFRHAGLTTSNNRVISKWGTGHLYEHELLDVPDSYGTGVRFFRSMPYEEAIERFTEFAREKGMFL
jgi:hypothetical protein